MLSYIIAYIQSLKLCNHVYKIIIIKCNMLDQRNTSNILYNIIDYTWTCNVTNILYTHICTYAFTSTQTCRIRISWIQWHILTNIVEKSQPKRTAHLNSGKLTNPHYRTSTKLREVGIHTSAASRRCFSRDPTRFGRLVAKKSRNLWRVE
jgi:hypothetical protein